MPPIKPQKDEVPVMQAGTNTRIEIPKKYVDLFGIQKGSKKTMKGDFFVWEYLPEKDLFHCYLRPRQKSDANI